MAVHMGPYSYGDPICRGELCDVRIGAYSSIAQGCVFDCGFNHNPSWCTTYPFPSLFGWEFPDAHPVGGDIVIGSDVWIGERCTIMSGVHIGDGAIIGCCSVVTRDVSPYAVVAGVPALFRKWRFREDIIERFLAVRWWDWDHAKVRAHERLLCQPDPLKFLSAIGA